jgi:hypothetical protein
MKEERKRERKRRMDYILIELYYSKLYYKSDE